MANPVAGFLLVVSLVATAASADVVHLRNGKSFEGVIAREAGSAIHIQLQFGELKLPASLVLRVERSDSGLREYLDRSAALRADPRSTARQWLDLARWALGNKLEHNFREAALMAAELEPGLEELAPIMRGFGLVLDQEIDRWVPYGDYMRRAGFVHSNGIWISREEWEIQDQRAREARSAAERSKDSLAEERLSRAVELLALAQVQRETSESRRRTTSFSSNRVVAARGPYYPVVAFSGWFFPPDETGAPEISQEPPADRSPIVREPQNNFGRKLLRRQPGSLLPVSAH